MRNRIIDPASARVTKEGVSFKPGHQQLISSKTAYPSNLYSILSKRRPVVELIAHRIQQESMLLICSAASLLIISNIIYCFE